MTRNNQIQTAIVGASGYSGEELVGLLLKHPHAELAAITSRQYAGQTLAQVFPKFAYYARAKTLRFSAPDPAELARMAQIIFLALPHGVAAEIGIPLLQAGCRIIDLSADFRLKSATVYQDYYGHPHPGPEWLEQSVYGLSEVNAVAIQNAKLVACPGCYPTSILLPVLPLLKARYIEPSSIIANSLSGVSGAGRKAELDYLFVECNESMRPYGVPKHRHLSEIEQELSLAAGLTVRIQFTPHLIPVNRGMITTLCLTPTTELWQQATQAVLPSSSEGKATGPDLCANAEVRKWVDEQIAACYQTAYAESPFVRILTGKALPDTKNVNGTNVIEIAWRLDPRTGHLIVMSALDNLVKGASGQAVQNFNLMCGYPETAGLF